MLRIKQNKIINFIIIPLIVLLPILSFSIPTVAKGTDNIRMIRHFDIDESWIIEFAGDVYTKGVIPLNGYLIAYPQLFFYISGVVITPYTLFNGLDYSAIAILLRTFNVFFAIILVLLLFYFVKTIFKSTFLAFSASFLCSTMPSLLWWSGNSRPHILSIIFILGSLFCLCKLIEKFSKKALILSIFFCSLSISTNFFGVFLIPSIIFAYYQSLLLHCDKNFLVKDLKLKSKLISISSIFVLLFSVCVPLFSIFVYFLFRNVFSNLGVTSFGLFLNFRIFRMILLTSIFIFLSSLAWIAIHNFIKKCLLRADGEVTSFLLKFIIFDTVCLHCVFFAFCSGVFVLLLNPAYLFYPLECFKATSVQLGMAAAGSGLSAGLNKPIFDASGLNWIRMLFDNLIFNKYFGLMLLGYCFYEVKFARINLKINKIFFLQRSALSLFCFFLMTVLIVAAKHRAHHYLLPIGVVSTALVLFGITELIKSSKLKFVKAFTVFLLIFLVGIGLMRRASLIHSLFLIKKQRTVQGDTALSMANWMENTFLQSSVIWTDSKTFYIPNNFNNIYLTDNDLPIENKINQISELYPDLLIITSQYDEMLGNAKKINKAIESKKIPNYRHFASFSYFGPLALGESEYGRFKEVNVYQKAILNKEKQS